MSLLGITDKVRHSSGPRTFVFSIPSHTALNGMVTCPGANGCENYCYAKKRRYIFSNVINAQNKALEHSMTNYFTGAISYEIKSKLAKRIRIHGSGDFYSRTYTLKWFDIINSNLSVDFYAYTKSVDIFKELETHIPKNLTLIYSYGGKHDALINPNKDRHSKIFNSLVSMKRHGYANASKDDSVALGPNHRIGLLLR